MSTKQRFDEFDPAEADVLTYDFTQGMSPLETLVGNPIITVVVDYPDTSADPTPAAILNGSPTFDATNKLIFVPVLGGVDGVDYDIKVECQTSNPKKFLALACILPVRTQ